jgi:death-on-curing protein
MAEPVWVDASLLLELHHDVIELSGGSHGVRDLGLLESALARPQNLFAYEGMDDLIVLAATYAAAI